MAKKDVVVREVIWHSIDEESIKQVTTYIPLAAKTEWVRLIADECMDKVMLSFNGESMPLMFMENADKKSRFLLGFFLRLYLNWNWEHEEGESPVDEWLVPYDVYDQWMRGHIFAQIEKLKSNKDVKDICFNLLSEYKDVERRLNNEIYGKLQIKNDPVSRQIMQQQANMTPEAIEQLFDGLKEAQAAYDEYKESHGEVTAEAVDVSNETEVDHG